MSRNRSKRIIEELRKRREQQDVQQDQRPPTAAEIQMRFLLADPSDDDYEELEAKCNKAMGDYPPVTKELALKQLEIQAPHLVETEEDAQTKDHWVEEEKEEKEEEKPPFEWIDI